MIFSIDTESYYSKDVGITVQGHYHYLRHPECHIYMISIVGEDGFTYVGSFEDCPWHIINGHTWLHHNAYHEDAVFDAARELGKMPVDCLPKEVFCTADMAAYLGVPRSLAGACKELLGVEVDKGVRDRAKGKQWKDMSPEFQQEMIRYALDDARLPLRLWQEHSHKWPGWEREFSLLTRRMAQRGVMVDVTLVESYIGKLKRLMWEANKSIPWAENHPALSYKQLCLKCREVGIPPPASLAIDSEDCANWEEKYGDDYQWVSAMRVRRRANTFLKKLETLLRRVRPDGRVSMVVKYCGASTRRGSGDSGFNPQNMPRDPVLAKELLAFGVAVPPVECVTDKEISAAIGIDLRKCIIAPPGKKLVAPDLSQIECRVLAWLAGDWEKLALMEKYDPYEAYARLRRGYDRPEKLADLAHIPEFDLLRRASKAAELGLGFQCGPLRYVDAAWTLARYRISFEQAQRDVKQWRDDNPKTVRLWRKMQKALERSVGGDLVVTLPSGNTLTYKSINCRDGEYTGLVSKNGKMLRMKLYGGLLVENCLAAGTLVATEAGWVPIESVSSTDRVWDGEEFVEHDGAIFKGEQSVIDCAGVTCTPDHLFLTTDGWKSAESICFGLETTLLSPHNDEIKYRRQTVRNDGGNQIHHGGREENSLVGEVRLREGSSKSGIGFEMGAGMLQAMPFVSNASPEDTRNVQTPGVRSVVQHEGSLQSKVASSVPQLRRPRNQSMREMVAELREFLGRYGTNLPTRNGFGKGTEQRRLLKGELRVGEPLLELSEQTKRLEEPNRRTAVGFHRTGVGSRYKKDDIVLPSEVGNDVGRCSPQSSKCFQQVWDIKNCGPRNRFVVMGLGGHTMIAHNCTQAAARDVFAQAGLRLDAAGHYLILQTHDEYAGEEPIESDSSEMTRLMVVVPEWMSRLPLAAAADEGYTYAF